MEGEKERDLNLRIFELRQICEEEIRALRHKAEEAAPAFRRSLLASRTKAEGNIADRRKLVEAKLHVKELENDLREALIVKSCREAKYSSTTLSLSSAKARTEDLRKTVEKQRAKMSEYESVILLAMEELNQDNSKDDVDAEAMKEAISWYKKVLGFRTEGGEGVKFIFDKIDFENPDKEFSFTLRLNGDTYSLLQCDQSVSDVELLVDKLNQTNGLFKFVRAMRKKFQSAAENVITDAAHSELSTVSVSSPPASADDSRNMFSSSQKNPRNKRLNSPKDSNRSYSTRSSQTKSLEALRRSPRRKVN